MATFDPTINPTSDPSYLGYSRGTDNASFQQLADVPKLNTKYVEPDYKADKSTGKLLEGVGDVTGAGIKLAGQIQTTKLNDEVNKSINNVRDSFGVAEAVKNADYAKAVGAAGNDSDTTLLPRDPNLPPAVQRLGARIQALKQGVEDGSISNSAYYAKQDAAVRQIKAAHPGWEDDIDSLVKEKLGVTPANALRTSLQQDADKLAAKVSGQANEQAKWEKAREGELAVAYHGFDNYIKAKQGGETFSQAQAKVANIQGLKLQNDIQSQQIALRKGEGNEAKEDMSRVALLKATDVADHAYIGVMKSFAGENGDLDKLVEAISTGQKKTLTPDEQATARAHFALLEKQVKTSIQNSFNEPIFKGSTVSQASIINDQATIDGITKHAMHRIDTLRDTLFGGKSPVLMKMDADNAQAIRDAAASSVLRSSEAIAIGGAVKNEVGDNLASRLLYESGAYRDPLVKGITNLSLNRSVSQGYSIKQTFEEARKEGVNDPFANKDMIANVQTIIQNPELLKNPDAQKRAIEYMFKPENQGIVASVSAKNGADVSAKFFNTVINPATIESISKTDTAHKAMVTTWAESEWGNVYAEQVNRVNQFTKSNAEYRGLELKFDPKNAQFYYESSGPTVHKLLGRVEAPVNPGQLAAQGNRQLEGLNSSIQSMKRVWDMSGKVDMTEKLYSWLPSVGIEPGTPVYKLIQEEVAKKEGERVKNANP